jgi:hypothetical protein
MPQNQLPPALKWRARRNSHHIKVLFVIYGFYSDGGLGQIHIKENLLSCCDDSDYTVFMVNVILIDFIMLVSYSGLFLFLLSDLFQRKRFEL